MAKIFYSMAGEGRGHATRARALVEMLRPEHEFTLFAPEMAYALLSEAYRGTDVRVRRLAGLRFHYHHDRLSYVKTVAGSLGYLRRMNWMLRSLRRRIETERPDLCITDFEPLLPRAAQATGVPFISFDHQHFLSITDFRSLPPTLRWKADALGAFTKWFYRGQAATIVSSFYSPPRKRGLKNVVQTGVMLRPEILSAQPTQGDHLLVYLRRFPHENLLDALEKLGRPTIVYGIGQRPPRGPIQFRAIDEISFLEALATCDALVCNAGNQLVGEALFLRKPVLAIPEAGNLEQYINAHYLREARVGDWIDPARVSYPAVNEFFTNKEIFRAMINPLEVMGNEQAAQAVSRFLPVVSPDATPVVRHPRKKRANLLNRLVGFSRAVLNRRLNKTTLPRFLTYTVTFTCNAKCIMCDSWKIESKDDLSVDEVAEIFDELPTMDAVRLTGGEPFVRPDFPELVRLADQKLRPKALQITTNGFLTKRIVQFCEERRKKTPLYLLVSIDGVADKHNEIRGHSSAYKFALDTVTQLARRQKELNIHLSVNQTIVDADGAEQYRKLREVLKPLGIHNNVVMAYDTSATYSVERHIDVAPTEVGQFAAFGQIDNSILEDLIAEIDRDLARFPLLDRLAKRYYLRGIANRMIGRQGAPNPKCVALNTHMRLFPNGDVPTCQFNSKIVGNLRRQSFRDVWRSAAALHQRDWVQKCPGCWAECEVLPSAIYTLDLLTDSIRRLATPAPRPKIPVDVTP
jgi:uncharacterized protein (TIGR00661 family)